MAHALQAVRNFLFTALLSSLPPITGGLNGANILMFSEGRNISQGHMKVYRLRCRIRKDSNDSYRIQTVGPRFLIKEQAR